MLQFFQELKRRNVVKAAISFVVFSYAILEIATILSPILNLEKSYSRIILIVLVVLFPFWLVFAYIYEWTPEGFKQTDKIPEEQSLHRATSKRLNHYIIAGLSVIIVLLVIDRVFNVTQDLMNEGSKEKVIAVLPFSHQSADSTSGFFTSGVYDDVRTKLAGIQAFRIISKSSVAEYTDYQGDMTALGRRLSANYILVGTVRRMEDQVRITAELVDPNSNQTIWSDEFNGELKNIFELQSSIANQIAEKLEANLSNQEKDKIASIPTTNMLAYEDYLKARFTGENPGSTFDDWTEMVRLLEKATTADPKFSKAWTLMVEVQSARYDALNSNPDNESESKIALQAAKNALTKAKELAPDNWEVLSETGFYQRYIEGDAIAAMSSFEKAIQQNPSDLVSIEQLGRIYTYLGDITKTIEMMERGFQIAKDNGLIAYGLTFSYEMNSDFEKMVPVLEKLYELYPKEKHYLVDSKYYKFLSDGKLSSYQEFKKSIENTETEFPFDERAIQNKEMVVAMFSNEFDRYHENWKGKNAVHTKNHGNWVCPLVANENINQAILLLNNGESILGQQILDDVSEIVLRPIDRNSVCVFNPGVYLPKLDYLSGNKELAKQKLEGIVAEVLQNRSYLTGAAERSVLLQAADLIDPERVYYYYDLVAKNSISFSSFEKVCSDPWTYPNLIQDPKFIEEVKEDGRFVEFLESFGFLKVE